jgi:hypothetical protein
VDALAARPGHAPAGTPAAASRAPKEPACSPPDHKEWRGAGQCGGHERATTCAVAGHILESTTGSTDSGRRISISAHSRRFLVWHCAAVAPGSGGRGEKVSGIRGGETEAPENQFVDLDDNFVVNSTNTRGSLGVDVVRRSGEAGEAAFFPACRRFRSRERETRQLRPHNTFEHPFVTAMPKTAP